MRKKYKIKLEGHSDNPILEPASSFVQMQKRFGLKESFMRRLKENDCLKPTPIQIQGIPLLFSRHSAILLAETGSGKSLAFITPLLHMLK